jgi:hypothetical protein
MLNNFSRTNLFWDKFDWSGVPGGGSTNKGDKKSFDWSSLFSDTCKNIESGVTGAKNSLLNIKEKANASGKVNVNVMNALDSATTPETFGNMVMPTQPARHETFQSVL